jgi:hypothetical protein
MPPSYSCAESVISSAAFPASHLSSWTVICENQRRVDRVDSPAVVQTITAQAGSHCVHAGHLNRVELRSPAAYKNDLGTIDKVSAAAAHATPYPPGETGRTPRKHHPSGALVAVH